MVRINYAIEENWFGEPSIFFRVLVTDKASRPKRMDVVAPAVREAIWADIDPMRKWDLFAYIHFRNESEQAELKDPAWARPPGAAIIGAWQRIRGCKSTSP